VVLFTALPTPYYHHEQILQYSMEALIDAADGTDIVRDARMVGRQGEGEC